MKLSVTHTTRYTYDPSAAALALRLRLFPPQTAGQMTQDWTVTVNGAPVVPILTEASGDQMALWHQHAAVDMVDIKASGTVDTTDTAGVLRDLPEAAPPSVYLRETALTEVDDRIRALTEAVEGDDRLAQMHCLSALIQKAVSYRKDATTAATTAAEATALGAGVCQDQAHVFVAAARAMQVPARYVTGYLYDPDAGDMAEETHAWAEAHVSGLGWIGFDITHQLCPTDAYIRLSAGLDAADAPPVRGTVIGDAAEQLEVQVEITQAQSQSQSQS